MAEDTDFLRRLRELTGDDEAWDGFDPSAWRTIQADEAEEANEEVIVVNTDSAQDNYYDSDDSADMILNLHKLTPAERSQTRGCKFNKARQLASEEPVSTEDVERLEGIKWDETGMSMGEVSKEGEEFTAWRLVENYPFMFVGKANGERARPLFTMEALHEKLVWDLYYVHCPPEINKKAVLFVPSYQFQHLLNIVNAKLETSLTIPGGGNQDRFKMAFSVGNTPRPRFLGRTNGLTSFRDLCKAIPEPHTDDDLSKATQLGREEFERKILRTRGASKKVKKSDKNRKKRIKSHQEWGRVIKRVQRYLGLRGRNVDGVAVNNGEFPVLDISRPTADKPEGSVLFIAIDIEAWEEDQNTLTEVGIATLDTNDIQSVAPGEGGQNWFKHIKARHIRVKENSWAVNRRFVHGCEDRFDFGYVCPISPSQPNLLTALPQHKRLPPPLLHPGPPHNPHQQRHHPDPLTGEPTPRPVILVFHEASADTKYLRILGYSHSSTSNIREVVDTREMHQFLLRSTTARAWRVCCISWG
ncbi:hypothetical protein N0V88_005959 [Collariella sp. IMI 366227]|nr:hypothetical protein N0V88_005959 [Collariella sp. IMI 366227]